MLLDGLVEKGSRWTATALKAVEMTACSLTLILHYQVFSCDDEIRSCSSSPRGGIKRTGNVNIKLKVVFRGLPKSY